MDPNTLPVTIVIPTFARKDELIWTLDSLYTFGLVDGPEIFETIVVEQPKERNYSFSEEEIRNLRLKFCNLKWIRCTVANLPLARTVALMKSKGNVIYDLWSALLNSFSQYVPVLLFSRLFSQEFVAFYSLASQVLHKGFGIVGDSVGQVYFQKAAKLYASSIPVKKSLLKATLALFAVGVLPFLTVFILRRQIFRVIF